MQLFAEVASVITETAKALLLEDGSLQPMGFLVGYGNEVVAQSPLWMGTPSEKLISMRGLAAAAQSPQVAAIMVITDAWMKVCTSAEEMEGVRAVSECPDRTEALVLLVSPKDGPDWGYVVEYERNRPGGTGKDMIVITKQHQQTEMKMNHLPPAWKIRPSVWPATVN